MKNKDSSILGINSILETPKTFIPSSIKSHIQAKGLIEVIRNPPKVPSFLLGFTLTLLIGLAILKKGDKIEKNKLKKPDWKTFIQSW